MATYLAFLTDIMGILNTLNIQLQGKNKNIDQMISNLNAFKDRLDILHGTLTNRNFPIYENSTNFKGLSRTGF